MLAFALLARELATAAEAVLRVGRELRLNAGNLLGRFTDSVSSKADARSLMTSHCATTPQRSTRMANCSMLSLFLTACTMVYKVARKATDPNVDLERTTL